MTSAFPSQRLKIRFLPAVPGTDAKGSSIAAKFWYDQAKIQADIALQANETKVDKAGSVMTGPLTLFGDPTSDLVAATKHYADTKVAKAGDSMSGFLTLNADPTATLHAATKSYADTKVALSGGTMSGTLVLNGPPVGPNDAATKQYADGAVSIVGGGLFQPLDADLSSIATGTVVGSWLFRRGNGDWAPVVIGNGLSFDTINGQLQSVGGGGGGGTGDVSASDGPVLNQLALWIGSNTIKGIDIGAGLQLQTVGANEALVALGTVTINGTPTPGQYATWFDADTIQGTDLDADLVALANLTGTNTIYYRSAANTWSPVNVSSGLTFVGGDLKATGSINIAPTPTAGQTAKWTNGNTLKGANVYTTAATAPATPDVGDFWYDTSTGVLAVNVDDGNSKQWLQVAPGAGNIASNSAFVKTRVFTTNGIYVPTPGTQFAVVECVGGGGGGGGFSGINSAFDTCVGAGGSGGYSRATVDAAAIGTSQSITVGIGGTGGPASGNDAGVGGGDTSFGSLCLAKGGGGGGGYQSATYVINSGPGGSTVGAIGDIVAAGKPGESGSYSNTSSGGGAPRSNGGSSIFGGGGITAPPSGAVSVPGGNASNYGSGGGGAFSRLSATPNFGGNGSPGVVIITEYNIGVGQQGPQGLAGGVTTPLTPQGRLTLQSGVPVMTTTQANKTTVFYTPYCGNQIPLFNGSSWVTSSFNELSRVGGAGNFTPNMVSDWFVYDNAGTLTLTWRDWANDTTRIDPLVRVNGILLNSAAVGLCAAQRGTYVGTTRSNASSNVDWIFGSSAASGGMSSFCVWNAYNRVVVASSVFDSSASWTYAGTSFQPAHGSSTFRHTFVFGLAEDCFTAEYIVQAASSTTAIYALNGTGIDSTTVLAPSSSPGQWVGIPFQGILSSSSSQPLLGFHFVSALENTQSGLVTYTNGSLRFQGKF